MLLLYSLILCHYVMLLLCFLCLLFVNINWLNKRFQRNHSSRYVGNPDVSSSVKTIVGLLTSSSHVRRVTYHRPGKTIQCEILVELPHNTQYLIDNSNITTCISEKPYTTCAYHGPV